MKESESSFDVTASVRDLQEFVGGFVDKIYHPKLDSLILSIRTPGEGKAFIHFEVGRWLYRSGTGPADAQQPSDFAMMLRKRITNAKITAVRQQGFDRIAVLSLDKEGGFDLILELFAEGNVILVKEGVIVQPLTSHTWKHRDVRAKRDFLFPPPIPDPSILSVEEFNVILKNSDTDLVRTLATRLNIGGRYSEEICARAGISKATQSQELTIQEGERILGIVKDMQQEILRNQKGYIVMKGQDVEDVVPFKMSIYTGFDAEEYNSFSAAIESYVHRLPKPKKEKPKESFLEMERLKRKLLQQESAVTRILEESKASQTMGDFIFSRYPEVSAMLAAAKENLQKSAKMDSLPGFLSYDRRTAQLKVKIEEATIELNVKGTVESNAQDYYEEAKKARGKLEGLHVALEDSRKAIDDLEKGLLKTASEARPKRVPTKKFWFERFRWFISSEGAIVLGGKDSKSNDLLVKKHLQPGDRYAHADIHGAPSVVIKMKEGATEKTLHEACEFAVATSKAWNAKIGSGAGYWVLPEQVSKTPESGEYLPKGAFVIRGKRNYSDKLEVKLGIGEIEFEGYRKIMSGPESAIRAHSRKYVLIRPGDTDKDSFAKKLADVLEVPIEEIQSIMPPGDIQVVEQVGIVIS